MNEEIVKSEPYLKYLHNLLRFGCIPFSVEERGERLEKIAKNFDKADDYISKFNCALVRGMIKILPQMPMQIKTIQIVTVLETYLKDKFLEILLRKPESMMKFYDREIRLGCLFEEGKDVDRIVAEHVVNLFNFQYMKDIKKIFEEYFKIDISEKEKQNLQILFQIRHILVHNSGVIDKDFLSKAKSDQKEGETIKLDKNEVYEQILSVCKFVNSLEDQLNSKFGFRVCLVVPEDTMSFLAVDLN